MAAALWRWQPSGAGAHRCRCPALPADAPGFSAIKWRSSLFSLSTAVPCTLKCSVNHCLPPCLFPHKLPKPSLGVRLLLFHSFGSSVQQVIAVAARFLDRWNRPPTIFWVSVSWHRRSKQCVWILDFDVKRERARQTEFLFRMETSVCYQLIRLKVPVLCDSSQLNEKILFFFAQRLPSSSPDIQSHGVKHCDMR